MLSDISLLLMENGAMAAKIAASDAAFAKRVQATPLRIGILDEIINAGQNGRTNNDAILQ